MHMRTHLFLTLLLIATVFPATGQETVIPRPAPHQLKWHEAEMGVVFHYDLHVFDGTRYGDLFMIWFDGGADDPKGNGPDVLPIISKHQPECLFYHNVDRADFRWGGSESGTVGYPCWSSFPYPYSHSNNTEGSRNHTDLLKHGDKDGQYWVPAMADTPLRGMNGRHEWFWEPDDDGNIYPVDSLMNMYYK